MWAKQNVRAGSIRERFARIQTVKPAHFGLDPKPFSLDPGPQSAHMDS
jgi:hypothetical protein